jgi:hypothetical protein
LPRNDFGLGLTYGESDEGGFEEFRLFCPSCRCTSATAARTPPRTLMQAHGELVRIRPGRDASSAAWRAYYQRSVSLYEKIAEIDPGHEGEALYWRSEKESERGTSRRIRAQAPDE